MDVAKLIAVLAGTDQPLASAYGIGNVNGERLPLVQVPTTAGTGSEVTNIAIVTTGETTKMGVVAPQLYADLAVLDADLDAGLAATGDGRHRHRRHGARDRSLYQPPQEESDFRFAGEPGAGHAVAKIW